MSRAALTAGIVLVLLGCGRPGPTELHPFRANVRIHPTTTAGLARGCEPVPQSDAGSVAFSHQTVSGSSPARRLFEIGTSMRRNFPATGTAGLARSLVSGHNRVPCPPPRMAVTTFRIGGGASWTLSRTLPPAAVGPCHP